MLKASHVQLAPNSPGGKVARFSYDLYLLILGFLIVAGAIPVIGIFFQFAHRRYHGIPLGQPYGNDKDIPNQLTETAELFERLFLTDQKDKKKTKLSVTLEAMGLILSTIFPAAFFEFSLNSNSPYISIGNILLLMAIAPIIFLFPPIFPVTFLPFVFGLWGICALFTISEFTMATRRTTTLHPAISSPKKQQDRTVEVPHDNSLGKKILNHSKGIYLFILGFLSLGSGIPIIGIFFQFAHRRFHGLSLGEQYTYESYIRLTKTAELFERLLLPGKQKATFLEVMALIVTTIIPLGFGTSVFLLSPFIIIAAPIIAVFNDLSPFNSLFKAQKTEAPHPNQAPALQITLQIEATANTAIELGMQKILMYQESQQPTVEMTRSSISNAPKDENVAALKLRI